MIKKGMIIEGSFWLEPIEIKEVKKFRNCICIIRATVYSDKHID